MYKSVLLSNSITQIDIGTSSESLLIRTVRMDAGRGHSEFRPFVSGRRSECSCPYERFPKLFNNSTKKLAFISEIRKLFVVGGSSENCCFN